MVATTRTDPSPLRVLVADDNPDAAKVMLLLLRLWGHEVDWARTGLEALRAVHTFRPDVALVDLLLPELSGYAVAEHLRRQVGGKQPILIAYTGLGDREARRRSAQAGFARHLVKPFEPARLRELLARYAREKEASGRAVAV